MSGPITSAVKFANSGDQFLVLKVDISNRGLLGYLKFGQKQLYFYMKNGKVIQRNTMCILDFYVDEAMQRGGLGHELFDRMLQVRVFAVGSR